MKDKKVKEFMITVDKYPSVHYQSSVFDAIEILEEAQKNLPENLHPYRAVLVVDDKNSIIGKVGHFALLKALEPKYNTVAADVEKLSKANLSSDFVKSMMDHFQLWNESFFDICALLKNIPVKDIMHPTSESIDENSTVGEAIHKLIMWQTLSILVSRDGKIIGIIRISDIYNKIVEHMKKDCK